jgi:ribosomal protein L37E
MIEHQQLAMIIVTVVLYMISRAAFKVPPPSPRVDRKREPEKKRSSECPSCGRPINAFELRGDSSCRGCGYPLSVQRSDRIHVAGDGSPETIMPLRRGRDGRLGITTDEAIEGIRSLRESGFTVDEMTEGLRRLAPPPPPSVPTKPGPMR